MSRIVGINMTLLMKLSNNRPRNMTENLNLGNLAVWNSRVVAITPENFGRAN